MGLDIYFSSNKKELIATIDSTDSIDKQLSIFHQKTGLIIDEYGTTNLYIDHIKLLKSLIKDDNNWSVVFEKAIDTNSGLIIIGD